VRDPNDRLVLALFGAALLGLALLALNSWLLFGIVACGMLVLGLALGFGAERRSGLIATLLLFLFAGYAWLVWGMAGSDRPGDPLLLIGGLPRGTALLVYGIWPIPLLAGLIYGLVFRTRVLPPDKLQQFLAEHRRR
jgi:hypothetical protein